MRLRSLFLACCAIVFFATRNDGAPFALPPLAGELVGEFAPLNVPDAPRAKWKLTLRPEASGGRGADLVVEGEGMQVAAELRFTSASTDEFDWDVRRAEIELERWWPALRPYLPEKRRDLTVRGALSFKGRGKWREGKPDGSVSVRLKHGRIEVPSLKLTAEGVEFAVDLDELPAPRSAPGQTLSWRSGSYDVIALGAGRIVFQADETVIRIVEAVLETLGGRLHVAPFTVPIAQPTFTMHARAEAIDVSLLLPLLPPILSEVRGRLDGNLTLRRNDAGISIGAGRLSLASNQNAQLRLLPGQTDIFSRLPEQVLKYAPGLAKIETGEVPILAHRLEVKFMPEADAMGRTATIHLEGEPVDPGLRAPIILDVNVRGPLETLVKFGTDSRLRFGGGN